MLLRELVDQTYGEHLQKCAAEERLLVREELVADAFSNESIGA